eukprot:5077598-Pleurochrysis_carterae.AAC.2
MHTRRHRTDKRANKPRRDGGRDGKALRAVAWRLSIGFTLPTALRPRSAHPHTPRHPETDRGGQNEWPAGHGAQLNLVVSGAYSQPKQATD